MANKPKKDKAAELRDIMKKIWPAFKRRLSKRALGITGTYYSVCDIAPHTDIGYTMPGNRIYLSNENDLLDHFDTIEERLLFIEGVFWHEIMHQLETDFTTSQRMFTKLNPIEARIFSQIANVIEDPSIEYAASRYMGGDALKALHFAVRNTYRFSDPIDENASAFSQYMNAIVQYGDGGFLKGNFSSDEAKKVFLDTIPLIDKTIVEPSGKKRVEMQKQVFEMTRPLWEEEAKAQAAFMKLLDELFKQLGKNPTNCGGKRPNCKPSAPGEGEADPSEASVMKKRNITFRKISKEEAEQISANSSPGSIPPDGDLEILIVEDDDPNQSGNGGASIPMPSGDQSGKQNDQNGDQNGSGSPSDPSSKQKDGNENGSGDSNAGDKDGDDIDGKSSDGKSSDKDDKNGGEESKNDSSDNGDKSKSHVSKMNNNSPYNPIEVSYDDMSNSNGSSDAAPSGNGMRITYDTPGGEIVQKDGDNTEESEDWEISSEQAARISAEVEDCLVEIETERAGDDAAMAADLDIPEVDKQYTGVSVQNNRIPPVEDDSIIDAYNHVVSLMKGRINRTVSQLRRIIRNDAEDVVYRNSGRINIKRLSDARLTSHVFDRRIDPGNKADMAVCIAVDNSGSMCGSKISLARECVIGLTEVFAQLDIPVKVIGFTDGKYDAVHYHYVNWRVKSIKERATLMLINAYSCNFDGFAIRYATKALEKRPEENKLLIVISDGQPSSSYYHGRSGVADAKDAISEATKIGSVIGVGIDANIDVLYTMYGPNFLQVTNVHELFDRLADRIKKEMKR